MQACALALVLLLDSSGSVPSDAWATQIEGHARALESAAVTSALRPDNPVAVRVDAFASDMRPLVGWTMLSSEIDAARLAAELRATVPGFTTFGGTSTAAALVDAQGALQNAPCEAERQVIDLVTDGIASDGTRLPHVMESITEAGIRVNGLFVWTDRGEADTKAAGFTDGADWLRQHATTYDGFVFAAESWQDFVRAIRTKISLEITGLPFATGEL